jgi:transmembrane sensor
MDHKKIINFLEGKTTGNESWKIREWLQCAENEKEAREILSDIWMHSEISVSEPKPDFEEILNQVHHLINLKEKPRVEETLVIKFYRTFSKIAAILILPLLIAFGYYMVSEEIKADEEPISQERIIVTKPGSRMKVDLPDGTIAWLNDGTTLKYPDRFAKNERRVFVDGEAYFEVVSNSDQPFVVENPMMDTWVTGTKFNLNAYTSDNYFEATLLEGQISLEKQSQRFKIEPGHQVQIDKSRNNSSYEKVDPKIATAWIDGRLILQNEPLSIAAKKLSRWYNIDIIIQSPELNDYLITATIEDEKPEQTFKLIAFALPVKYNIKTTVKGNDIKRTIYLTKK